MALDKKSSGFGFGVEDRFKKVTSTTPVEPEQVAVAKEEQKPVVIDSKVSEPAQKERKQKRVQLLTYESLITRMDNYAAKRGVSRAAVFEAAVEAYLDKVDPKKSKK